MKLSALRFAGTFGNLIVEHDPNRKPCVPESRDMVGDFLRSPGGRGYPPADKRQPSTPGRIWDGALTALLRPLLKEFGVKVNLTFGEAKTIVDMEYRSSLGWAPDYHTHIVSHTPVTLVISGDKEKVAMADAKIKEEFEDRGVQFDYQA